MQDPSDLAMSPAHPLPPLSLFSVNPRICFSLTLRRSSYSLVLPALRFAPAACLHVHSGCAGHNPTEKRGSGGK